MNDRIHVNVWTPQSTKVDDMKSVYSNMTATPVCNQSGYFDYVWGPDTERTYFGHACRPVCNAGIKHRDCYMRVELEQLHEDGVFFVTEVFEVPMTDGQGNQTNGAQRLFTPFEHVYRFSFMYSFDYPQEELRSVNNLWLAQSYTGSSNTETLTVVLDEGYREARRVQPSSSGISFGLQELFELAGAEGALDKSQPTLGKNYLLGAGVADGPVGRLTGIELLLNLHCYNEANVPRSIDRKDWKGHICTVRVSMSPPRWVSTRAFPTVNGVVYDTHYHGVRVRVIATGSLRLFDMVELLAFIARVVVLLRLPRMMFAYLISTCLGKLSTIWKGILIEEFSIPKHLCSLAIDVITKNQMFHLLSGQSEGVTLRQMTKLVAEAFQDYKNLDYSEVHAFTLFCFSLAYDMDTYRKGKDKRVSGKIMNSFEWLPCCKPAIGSEHSGIMSSSDVMACNLDITQFTAASCMAHEVELKHAVQLFDKDAGQTFMERLVTPGWMRRHVLQAHDVVTSADPADHGETEPRTQSKTSSPTSSDSQTLQEKACQPSPSSATITSQSIGRVEHADLPTLPAGLSQHFVHERTKLQEEMSAMRRDMEKLNLKVLEDIKKLAEEVHLRIAEMQVSQRQLDHGMSCEHQGLPAVLGNTHQSVSSDVRDVVGNTMCSPSEVSPQLVDQALDQKIQTACEVLESKCHEYFGGQIQGLKDTLTSLEVMMRQSSRSVDEDHNVACNLSKRLESIEHTDASKMEHASCPEKKLILGHSETNPAAKSSTDHDSGVERCGTACSSGVERCGTACSGETIRSLPQPLNKEKRWLCSQVDGARRACM